LPVPVSITVANAGDWGTAEVADFGVVVGGWDSFVRTGDNGVAFANFGRAEAGKQGVALSSFADVVVGDFGFAIAVHGRQASSGFGGFARAAEFGSASAGGCGMALVDNGVATVGDGGIAIAWGNQGVAVGGVEAVALALGGDQVGTMSAGEGGILLGRWHDGKRFRLVVAYVGENGISSGTSYTLDDEGHFIEVVNNPE
jgi:hypothetical protein